MSPQQQEAYVPNAHGQGKNQERRRATQKAWYEANKEDQRRKARERQAIVRAADPAAWAAYCAQWRADNRNRYLALKKKESERARRRKGMAPRQRKHDAHVKQWLDDQKRVRLESKVPSLTPAERAQIKSRSDPAYVINMRMRVSVRKAMAGGKAGRSWESLVGYSLQDLVLSMKRQLPKGYTMDDFFNGRLHIDHIIPKCMFNVTNVEELKACWSLANLRPLPAKKNLSKGSKRVTLC